mmetsp:Transcript_15440/g.50761  ORF Transcript_15440/g.50761 Transcript_15440/m.50761 type:complete len:218 (-) Transcript_15440:48-701(-)
MTTVTLHVYDITNAKSETANKFVVGLNQVVKDALNVGGVFHGAVEVYGDEWSYGYCQEGTGVFSCRPKRNYCYTYRESITLGVTAISYAQVRAIVERMTYEWMGDSYDLLAKNCNHFCDSFAEELGVGPIPLWVNRLANTGDAVVEASASLLSTGRDWLGAFASWAGAMVLENEEGEQRTGSIVIDDGEEEEAQPETSTARGGPVDEHKANPPVRLD